MTYFVKITYEHYDTSYASIYVVMRRTIKKDRKKYRGGQGKYVEYRSDKALCVMATCDSINYSRLSFLLFENF